MTPDQTLATQTVKGKKKDKEQITVLLCMNAAGTDKLKPLVIRKSAKPQCFKNISKKNLGIKYEVNKKAWMKSDIFECWIKSLDDIFRQNHRRILLLVDNTASHIVREESEHVKIYFLPPNTTAHLQPCDAGIINFFKAYYQKLYLQHVLEVINAGEEMSRLNIKKAIDFTVEA